MGAKTLGVQILGGEGIFKHLWKSRFLKLSYSQHCEVGVKIYQVVSKRSMLILANITCRLFNREQKKKNLISDIPIVR